MTNRSCLNNQWVCNAHLYLRSCFVRTRTMTMLIHTSISKGHQLDWSDCGVQTSPSLRN
jgi:hypothetical protein